MMYGITADELHRIIIDDLKARSAHHDIASSGWVLQTEQQRPLWQTIRMIIELSEDMAEKRVKAAARRRRRKVKNNG